VVLGRLGHAAELRDFGQDFFEEAGAVQQLKSAAGVAFGEHAGELVADAFAADLSDSGGELADGALGFRFDGEVEAGRRNARRGACAACLLQSGGGLANGADDAVAEIVLPRRNLEPPT